MNNIDIIQIAKNAKDAFLKTMNLLPIFSIDISFKLNKSEH